MKLIPLPGNIRSRRFRFNHSAPAKIETFTVEEVRAILERATLHERTKLYLLLMLNCGMYQNDIAELRADEVNWKKGTLTRARSKTRESDGPVVTYRLWPETSPCSGSTRRTESWRSPRRRETRWSDTGWKTGRSRRYDAIQSAWARLAQKMGTAKSGWA